VASERSGRWGRAVEVPGSGVLNAGGFASVFSVPCGVVGMALASGRHPVPVPVHAVIGLGSRWSGPARIWTGPGRGRPVPAGFVRRGDGSSARLLHAYLPFVTVRAVIADAVPRRTGAATMAGSTGAASARR
jgi:hypothetical protein